MNRRSGRRSTITTEKGQCPEFYRRVSQGLKEPSKNERGLSCQIQGLLAPIRFIGCTSMVMDSGIDDDDDDGNTLNQTIWKNTLVQCYNAIRTLPKKLPLPPKPNLRCESMKICFHSPRWYTGERCKPDSSRLAMEKLDISPYRKILRN